MMTGTKYIPISTDGSKVVEFEDDAPVLETKIEDAGTTEPVLEEPKKVEPKQERHKSRAQERIKELVAKSHEKDYQLQQALAQTEDLRRQLLLGNTSSKESLKSTLEGQVTSLNSQLVTAMQSGDSTEVIRLQDLAISAKMDLNKLSSELKDNYVAVERAKAAPVQQPIRQENQVPEKALDWIADHPVFKSDELFYNSSLVVNNQLLREGFDATSDAFYEELDARLSKRFPEVFGVTEQKGVTLSNKTDSPEAQGVKHEAPVQSTTKARTVEQVVSGSSRPSANVIQKRITNQVTLSAADVKQAEARSEEHTSELQSR